MKRFSIVGAGRLGVSLGTALARKGWTPEAVVDRDARAARRGRRFIGGGRASTAPASVAGGRGTVIIAVPDGEVRHAASALARSGGSWAGRVVFHTSGILPAAALAPLARRGARVAALHPSQAFPRPDMPASVFVGVTWGFEGDQDAVGTARAIVRALRGHILFLSAKDKALYHAACALASNALVALEWTAGNVLGKAGITEDAAAAALAPLVQGTLHNVKTLGPAGALTGPILRGDLATVRKHLGALESEPEARAVYAALGRQILRLAEKRGLAESRVRSLRRLLGGR
jgi:predicted short-subunit dehydrogenase-like oxidoreductase (DUF2520 family)